MKSNKCSVDNKRI